MANERCAEEEAEATLSNLKMEGRCWLRGRTCGLVTPEFREASAHP